MLVLEETYSHRQQFPGIYSFWASWSFQTASAQQLPDMRSSSCVLKMKYQHCSGNHKPIQRYSFSTQNRYHDLFLEMPHGRSQIITSGTEVCPAYSRRDKFAIMSAQALSCAPPTSVSVWVCECVSKCVSVCVGECVGVWVCVCESVWVCECVSVWVCECVSVWLCVCVSVGVCVSVWVCVCECASVWVCECVKVWVCERVGVSGCECESVRMWECESVSMRECESVSVKVWECDCEYVWMCEGVSVCEYVSVWVCGVPFLIREFKSDAKFW